VTTTSSPASRCLADANADTGSIPTSAWAKASAHSRSAGSCDSCCLCQTSAISPAWSCDRYGKQSSHHKADAVKGGRIQINRVPLPNWALAKPPKVYSRIAPTEWVFYFPEMLLLGRFHGAILPQASMETLKTSTSGWVLGVEVLCRFPSGDRPPKVTLQCPELTC